MYDYISLIKNLLLVDCFNILDMYYKLKGLYKIVKLICKNRKIILFFL